MWSVRGFDVDSINRTTSYTPQAFSLNGRRSGSQGRLTFWFGGMVLALFVMMKVAPNIDVFGHVGGVLGGYLISMCMADMKPEHQPEW